MRKIKIVLLHLLCFVVLTALSQVGGVLWLFSLFLSIKLKKKKRYVFPIVYLIFNVLIIPPIANQLGRKKLPVFQRQLQPKNLFYPLLFRNYVDEDLEMVLKMSSSKLFKKDIGITYLDANFPFLDGFPLLPHRSHDDGKKIDISFMYLDDKGKSTNKKPSISGYGVYVNETNITTNNCLKKGYWQYDFPKYLTFGTINMLKLDEIKTRSIIEEFLSHRKTEKIFIEPYIKQNLNLNSNKIRFHGCKAVRHDDHIHLQTK